MSLWRVKHTLSPVVEYALIALVAAYGLFGIYLSSLRPFAVAAIAPVTSIDESVPLEVASWTRCDNRTYGYAFAAPPGWKLDDRDPARVRIARSDSELAAAGQEGEGLLIERVLLYEGKTLEDVAVADFGLRRPALYDVAVDGRAGLFAIEFEDGRVRRQVVYVLDGDHAFAIRTAGMDPAAFSVFLSNFRFYSDVTTSP